MANNDFEPILYAIVDDPLRGERFKLWLEPGDSALSNTRSRVNYSETASKRYGKHFSPITIMDSGVIRNIKQYDALFEATHHFNETGHFDKSHLDGIVREANAV